VEEFTQCFPEDEDPDILEEETRAAVNQSPRIKSPGIDSLTSEAIHASGEAGVRKRRVPHN